jgi:hypothetical protein
LLHRRIVKRSWIIANVRSETFRYPLMQAGQPSGAQATRIRTAQIGNREKREPRRVIRLKFALSGPGLLRALCQNPAKAREILGLSPGVRPKSLQPVTRWRRERDSNPRYLSVHTLSKRAP